MASYKDWMNIENPNSLSERDLRRATSSMASAANKRLKRFSNRGINYGEETSGDIISGVRRFTTRGKDINELKNEFKRVRNFLNSPQSSLTGMKKVYKEFKDKISKNRNEQYRKLNKREQAEYNKMKKQKKTSGIENDKRLSKWEELKQWRETWKLYNRLVDEGVYTPTEYDSNQAREVVIAVIQYRDEYQLTYEETWERLLFEFQNDYESRQMQELDDVSTSDFFSIGSSD